MGNLCFVEFTYDRGRSEWPRCTMIKVILCTSYEMKAHESYIFRAAHEELNKVGLLMLFSINHLVIVGFSYRQLNFVVLNLIVISKFLVVK